MNPRAGVDDVEKRKFLPQPGLELRVLGRPARSQSLYRLRYPGVPVTFQICMLPIPGSNLVRQVAYPFLFRFLGWVRLESTWYVGH
jgi:hypothetical protein